MKKIRHVLGISGGKDSTALAIYLNQKYPELDLEYYFCDTGTELDETYQIIEKLESVLGKKIEVLHAVKDSPLGNPFDHFLELYGGYLPSSQSRWCTRTLKLEPFERYVKDDPVVSYVGIRGDERREAYISTKPNIQSIFPFRKNIWSEDVIGKILANSNIEHLIGLFEQYGEKAQLKKIVNILKEQLSFEFNRAQKLNAILDVDVISFNHVVIKFLKNTEYPLARVEDFPLINNDENLVLEDILTLLEESGVGLPKYYNKIDFNVGDQTGQYARSRSGCYFCFFQQKIEWVWLFEQHLDLFEKAMEYEKDGFSWNQGESLKELKMPERIEQIKKENIKRTLSKNNSKSSKLLNILDDDENTGCAACFI